MQTFQLSEAIEKYLEWKSGHTSRAYINYRPWLVRFSEQVGNRGLTEVTLEDVGKYSVWLQSRYQPYTIQLAMVALHNFFMFYSLQRYECLPPSLIRVPRTSPKPRPVVSDEDYDKLLGYFTSKSSFIDQRNEVMVRVLWDTGVRVSELCELNLADVKEFERECLVRTRKSHRMRQIFWTPETHALLKEYIKIRTPLSNSPALFIGFSLSRNPVRIRTRSVERIVTKISTEVGLGKKITPHSFRHGKAHRILKMGGNVKHVGAILGHSEFNPVAAMSYLQFDNAELRAAAKRFNKKGVKII